MALNLEFIKNRIGDGIFFSSDRASIEYLLEKDCDPLGNDVLLVNKNDVKLISSDSLTGENIKHKNIYVDEKAETIYTVKFFESSHNTIHFVGDELYERSLIKSEAQISNIEETLALNEAAYKTVVNQMRSGMSEMDIFCILKSVYNEQTAENTEFISDVIAGKRTALVSGAPTGYRLSFGDAVILDLLPRYKGTYCDTTRTIFLGKPSEKQKTVYEVLAEAIEIGAERLKPGTCAEDIYFVIYGYLKKYGYENYFPHHAGHGFGRTIYEKPYFLPNNKTELKENMVVTLEPGIYLPNQFGIRLENNFRITNNGAKLLGNIPLGIEANIA